MIAALKDKLSLNTSQQQQWDSMVAQTQAARQAARAGFDQIKAATQAEMAKAEPDLAALAAQVDAIHQQNDGARKTVRDGWLALYATFDAEPESRRSRRIRRQACAHGAVSGAHDGAFRAVARARGRGVGPVFPCGSRPRRVWSGRPTNGIALARARCIMLLS